MLHTVALPVSQKFLASVNRNWTCVSPVSTADGVKPVICIMMVVVVVVVLWWAVKTGGNRPHPLHPGSLGRQIRQQRD